MLLVSCSYHPFYTYHIRNNNNKNDYPCPLSAQFPQSSPLHYGPRMPERRSQSEPGCNYEFATHRPEWLSRRAGAVAVLVVGGSATILSRVDMKTSNVPDWLTCVAAGDTFLTVVSSSSQSHSPLSRFTDVSQSTTQTSNCRLSLQRVAAGLPLFMPPLWREY